MKIILSTTSNKEEAQKIAKVLISKKLAACINIIPQIISMYEWQNNFENDEESLMIIKTSDEMANFVKETILELHSYTLPEIIFLDTTGGHFEYENWVLNQLKK